MLELIKGAVNSQQEVKGICECRGLQVMTFPEKLTVCACAWHHPRVDAMDFLQLLHSNIMELVLISRSENNNSSMSADINVCV